jgi:hypothetical protein
MEGNEGGKRKGDKWKGEVRRKGGHRTSTRLSTCELLKAHKPIITAEGVPANSA